MKHNYSIRYKNVYLRPLSENDIELLRIWRNDPKNTEFLSKIPYITEDKQKEWFRRYIENENEICFAIIEDDELHRIVGSLSLHDFSNDSCFLGHVLIGDNQAHGKKVGVNASIAATKIAFKDLGLDSVSLYVFPANVSAYKVYQQAGFQIVDVHLGFDEKKEYTMVKKRG